MKTKRTQPARGDSSAAGRHRCAVAVAALLWVAGSSQAAEFCVRDGAELAAALAASEGNGEDDVIKLAAGNYTHPQGFSTTLANPEDLMLVGGWTLLDGACHELVPSAELSALDGEHQRPVLRFATTAAGGNLVVSNLSIERGPLIAGVGGLGVYGSSDYAGNVLVERVIAMDNRSAPIYLASSGRLLVRGALVANNTSASNGIHLVQWGLSDTAVVNSSVVHNSSSAGSYDAIAVSKFEAAPTALVSNSILQGNTAAGVPRDLYSMPYSIDFRNTLIQNSLYSPNGSGLLQGVAADFIAPELGDYRLHPGSAGIDAGLMDPEGGLPLLDLLGVPRSVGSAPDLGAFESEHSFLDGFE